MPGPADNDDAGSVAVAVDELDRSVVSCRVRCVKRPSGRAGLPWVTSTAVPTFRTWSSQHEQHSGHQSTVSKHGDFPCHPLRPLTDVLLISYNPFAKRTDMHTAVHTCPSTVVMRTHYQLIISAAHGCYDPTTSATTRQSTRRSGTTVSVLFSLFLGKRHCCSPLCI